MTDIPSWAVRRSKVVCVVSDNWAEVRRVVTDPCGLIAYPVRMLVYTIREVRVRYVPEYSEVLIGVLLDEVVNPVVSGGSAAGNEPAWDIRAFAPVRAFKQRAQARVPEFTS